MPPAYPAPSPEGKRPFADKLSPFFKSLNILTGDELLLSGATSMAPNPEIFPLNYSKLSPVYK